MCKSIGIAQYRFLLLTVSTVQVVSDNGSTAWWPGTGAVDPDQRGRHHVIVLQLAKHFLACLNIIVWHIEDMSCSGQGVKERRKEWDHKRGKKCKKNQNAMCVSTLHWCKLTISRNYPNVNLDFCLLNHQSFQYNFPVSSRTTAMLSHFYNTSNSSPHFLPGLERKLLQTRLWGFLQGNKPLQ